MFLHRNAAWALTETLGKRIDGCFNRLLESALEFIWKDHVSNTEIYAEQKKTADHCYRHRKEAPSNLVLWSHGKELEKADTYVCAPAGCEMTPTLKNFKDGIHDVRPGPVEFYV